jgi:aspartyl-tRNA(Asn)/glutamyl-tRNA(Gln) amidotransferase subunit C
MSFDVKYVAHLARIDLSPDEAARLQGQLSDILEYVNQLKQVDVTGVEPTAHAIPVENVIRADEVKPSLGREAVLSNAPSHSDDQFLVPKIIE